MAIETIKDNLQINKIVGQKLHTILLEEDCIVPDIKPDILNVLNTSGNICIYKKEIMDEKVKIEGCINTYIMYLADTQDVNTVRSLNTNLNFSQIIDLKEAKKDMGLDVNFVLKSLNCNILNGRKVNVKAEIQMEIKISSNENIEYIKEINNLKDIQVLKQNCNFNLLVGNGNTKVFAKDTIKINEQDNLVEIMKTDFKIINKETKISYNKVLIKADLDVKLLYLTDDNRMCVNEEKIPIMGFIDLVNISEEHICDVKYEIQNIVVKPNNIEEHSIYVETEIEAYCEAYENKEIEMLQDLYSPSVNLEYLSKNVNIVKNKIVKQQVYSIREKQIIAEMNNKKIYDVEVCPRIERQNVLNGKIVYEGEIEINFIYSAENLSRIETKQVSMPLNFNFEFDEIKQKDNIDTLIEITLQDFIVMPDDNIDIKIDLTFTAINMKETEISLIQTIEEKEIKEKNNSHSMVIYFTKPNDTLWKIAKKFRGTMDEIGRVNEIKDSDLQPGKQLFIPRYHG